MPRTKPLVQGMHLVSGLRSSHSAEVARKEHDPVIKEHVGVLPGNILDPMCVNWILLPRGSALQQQIPSSREQVRRFMEERFGLPHRGKFEELGAKVDVVVKTGVNPGVSYVSLLIPEAPALALDPVLVLSKSMIEG
jgi:hypothetical protein